MPPSTNGYDETRVRNDYDEFAIAVNGARNKVLHIPHPTDRPLPLCEDFSSVASPTNDSGPNWKCKSTEVYPHGYTSICELCYRERYGND
jgi:hypothetical protein